MTTSSNVQFFDLHVRVERSKVATIIEVLEGEGKLISCTEVDEPKRVHQPYRKVATDVTGYDFALSTIKELGHGKFLTSKWMAGVFHKSGRNPRSASPVITKLVEAGYLKGHDDGIRGHYTVMVDER